MQKEHVLKILISSISERTAQNIITSSKGKPVSSHFYKQHSEMCAPEEAELALMTGAGNQ